MVQSAAKKTTGLDNVVSDSLIRIELITHFHRNPGLEGTSMEIAEMIGRDKSRVESQMKKLIQLHILDEICYEGELRYRYVPPHYIPINNGRGSNRKPRHISSLEDDLESASETW